MKALSIRAPWWWFILYAGKDIENRDWQTNYRGTVYLHASKWWSKSAVIDDARSAIDCYEKSSLFSMAHTAQIKWDTMKGLGGCIVGTVDIIDCVSQSDSPWFFGKYGFVLANPVALREPIPCKGALGFFEVFL